MDPNAAWHCAERVRTAIKDFVLEDGPLSVKIAVSLGLAAPTLQDQAIGEILMRADQAHHHAEESGRNLNELAA